MPEVYFPGSAEPFRPLNPWGRPVPRSNREPRPPLYQVVVTRRGKEIPFGPKMEKRFVDEFHAAIVQAIRVGAERELSSPHIVAVEARKPRRETLQSLLTDGV